MQSKQFTLNKSDLLFVWERAKLFLIPVAVLYIPYVIENIRIDGFQLIDFGLNSFQLGVIVSYFLNRILTIAQLFIQGK